MRRAAGLWLVALLMLAMGGGNASAWAWAVRDGSLVPTLCAIAGVGLCLFSVPGLIALSSSARGRRR